MAKQDDKPKKPAVQLTDYQQALKDFGIKSKEVFAYREYDDGHIIIVTKAAQKFSWPGRSASDTEEKS